MRKHLPRQKQNVQQNLSMTLLWFSKYFLFVIVAAALLIIFVNTPLWRAIGITTLRDDGTDVYRQQY